MAYINADISCPICSEEFAYEFDTMEFENIDGWMCVDVPCQNCGTVASLSTWIEFDIYDIQNHEYSKGRWISNADN